MSNSDVVVTFELAKQEFIISPLTAWPYKYCDTFERHKAETFAGCSRDLPI